MKCSVNFRIKKAVDEILKWYAATSSNDEIKTTAQIASQIVEHWRNRRKEEKPEAVQMNVHVTIDGRNRIFQE